MQTTQIIDQNGSTGVRTENTTEATASVSDRNVQRDLFLLLMTLLLPIFGVA